MEAVPLQPADKQDHFKHVQNFVDCVKTRKRPACDIEFGHNSAFVAHLGNIAYRTGSQLEWDSSKNGFINNASASALIKPEYRSPWEFPKIV
jgi:hypothetical protein